MSVMKIVLRESTLIILTVALTVFLVSLGRNGFDEEAPLPEQSINLQKILEFTSESNERLLRMEAVLDSLNEDLMPAE